jgi:aryl-alcohol dehydrogenase-like predicted oxidoreductase
VILGATSMEQLRTDIAAADLRLPDEVVAGITSLHREHPIPL